MSVEETSGGKDNVVKPRDLLTGLEDEILQ